MNKRDSEAWRLALRICRRKGVNRRPVSLSPCGQVVTFQSTIRGNEWVCTLAHLRLLCPAAPKGAKHA